MAEWRPFWQRNKIGEIVFWSDKGEERFKDDRGWIDPPEDRMDQLKVGRRVYLDEVENEGASNGTNDSR